ncbi:MAG: 5-(carboxyamino)imidazole ribonucleotide synthase [Planctomycetota bacterium]|nr:5-(carboxyamino)imidazole ribonucleotide synthase [Planctomycetota bacterium]
MHTTAGPGARDAQGPELRSGRRLGIAGGGQLAKMLAQAAVPMDVSVAVLERADGCPASGIARPFLVGDWNQLPDLERLAAHSDVVTLESEFIDAPALDALAASGVAVYPRPATLHMIQDKFLQKQALADAGLPTAKSVAVADKKAVLAAAAELGWPLLLKARRNAYDGKGNATVRSDADLDAAWERLGGGRVGLYVEQFCDFASELAVMVTRGRDGTMAVYPVVETVQRDHVCHIVTAPAGASPAICRTAQHIARLAAEVIDAVGTVGVEMFLTRSGEVLVNELAPRVHNSGHYTIEACACSQFENHVRAVLGLPLGSPELVVPGAAMVNLLGVERGPAIVHGLPAALAVPGAHVHLYGKSTVAPGRKMGHITALGDTPQEAAANALRAAKLIRIGGEP